MGNKDFYTKTINFDLHEETSWEPRGYSQKILKLFDKIIFQKSFPTKINLSDEDSYLGYNSYFFDGSNLVDIGYIFGIFGHRFEVECNIISKDKEKISELEEKLRTIFKKE